MPKPRLTAAQHAEAGRQLAFFHDELTELLARIENAYPKRGPEAQAGASIRAAVRSLDTARSTLDGAFCREHPDAFTPRAYYPRPADRSWPTRTREETADDRS